MHRAQLVVELREYNAAGCVGDTKHGGSERQRLSGVRKLPADDQNEREACEEKKKTGKTVKKADYFVISREEVFEEQLLWIL
jgi:hypothetical protein